MTKPSILIVDDEPDNFDVIEAFLSNQGYRLYYAPSGHQAIASLDTINPGLILLDVMMPEIDGIEVCQQIKAAPKWQTTPIIMVTALSSKSDLARCLAAGADDFISKPISSIELRARVHSMLRIKQQYDNIQALSSLQKNTIKVLEGALNELSGNLASRLSHELNTPLNGILGTLELLQVGLDSMTAAEIRELLGWAEQSALRLESLTQKLLMYLELELCERQQRPLKSVQTPFSAAAVKTVFLTRAQRVNRSNDLVCRLEDTDVTLPTQYLSTLLYELIDNALKFSPPETPIAVSAQVVQEWLELSISNSGQGMTADQIAKIGAFMQFERDTYEQQGLGMGLTLVKKIVELAGGSFSISSVYQQDTTVHLTLPIFQGY